MKKFLVIFPLFLFLVALDAYLISDFVSNQNKPDPAVKGISTEADQNVIELEIKNEESEGERIMTSPTPIPVEIIDKSERKKGISSTYPITIVTKLGNHIPVSLSGTPLPNGGTIGIMTDLREMKKREKSEKILYNAIQFSADGMIMCDTDGIIHFWNKGAQIIFGKKYDVVIWKHIEKILWLENSKTILDFKENINKFHLKVSLPNKTSIEISLTLTPIFEETGNLIISYLLVCRDITTRKKLEQELSLSHQKIKEAYKQFGKIKREQDYIFEFLEFARENSGNIEKVANYIVSSLLMISQTDACEVLKVNYDSWKLESLSHFWFGSEWDNKKQVEYKDSLTYTAYQHQSSMKYVDFMIEPKYINKSFARKLGFTSLMVIPLSDTKKCIGGISLYTKSDKKLEIFENDFIEKYIKIVELVLGGLL